MERTSLRIGGFTGFHGDRLDGISQLLDAGVDVLAGDYLAELTMLVLHKSAERGGTGYVSTFVDVLDENLDRIAQAGTKVVTNAGGLDPHGCAAAIRERVAARGLDLVVASIDGDDVRDYLTSADAQVTHLESGERWTGQERTLTANAYLGAWPIATALREGADIVICPRTADASLFVGPAAWAFGWSPEDRDRLAAGVVVGHIIECSAQATGGNFAFFDRYPDLGIPGLPIAEIAPDGSATITKPAGTGGLVTVDTVKAQLFYEIGSPLYLNPDCVADLSTIELAELAPDRVAVTGVRGLPPTTTTKASISYEGGYRNTMTVGITGGRQEEKISWFLSQLEQLVGAPESFDAYRTSLIGPSDITGDYAQSTAHLIISVKDRDRTRVSRSAFADPIVQLALSTFPGFYMTTPPQRERLFGVQWPALLPKEVVQPHVHLPGREPIAVPWSPGAGLTVSERGSSGRPSALPAHETVDLPLSRVAGARSGDKGGSANVGVWAQTEGAYTWLRHFLTVSKLVELVPEAHSLEIERYEFENLWGINFVIRGFLDDGVSASLFIDPQAKGLGEYLLSRVVPIPVELI